MSDLDIARVFAGGPTTDAVGFTFDGPQEGVIHHVDPTGAYFTMPEWSEVLVFGPARWHAAGTVPVSGAGGDEAFSSHSHNIAAPAAGQVCVVLFVGPTVQRPWIVAWADA